MDSNLHIFAPLSSRIHINPIFTNQLITIPYQLPRLENSKFATIGSLNFVAMKSVLIPCHQFQCCFQHHNCIRFQNHWNACRANKRLSQSRQQKERKKANQSKKEDFDVAIGVKYGVCFICFYWSTCYPTPCIVRIIATKRQLK